MFAEGYANCLELSLLLCGLCLDNHVAPLLVVTEGHALVAIAPGRVSDGGEQLAPLALDGCAREIELGVHEVEDLDALVRLCADGMLTAVDAVEAVMERPFADASESGIEQVRLARCDEDDAPREGARGPWLIDIAALHRTPGSIRIRSPRRAPRSVPTCLAVTTATSRTTAADSCSPTCGTSAGRSR